MATGNGFVIGSRYDVIYSDGPQSKLIRDLELSSVEEDFLVFRFRTGHRISIGRRYIIKIEATLGGRDREAWR